MQYFFFGFALSLQETSAIFFGPDDFSNPRGDLFGLMRPDFLLDIDLLMRGVVLVMSLREGESFTFGGELVKGGGTGNPVDGFLIGLDVEDCDVVALVVEGIGASLY